MIIQFQPTGNIVSIPEQRPVIAALKSVVLPEVDTPYGGTITNASVGGSFRAFDADADKATIVWLGSLGGVLDEWQMDNKAAAELAVNTTIAAALAAAEPFLLLASDGYEYVPS